MLVRFYVCMSICVYRYACLYVRILGFVYVCMRDCQLVSMSLCVHACLSVALSAFMPV